MSSPPRPSRRALLVGLGALAAAGCTRFALPGPSALPAVTAATGGPRAGVRVTTYASDEARRSGEAYVHEVHLELWLVRGRERELVHRARHPQWLRADLVPGRYELVVVEVSDGTRARAPAGRTTRTFTVADGELAEVVLTIESFPWEAVVAVTIVVVVVVAVVAVLASNGGGPPGGMSVTPGGGGGGSPAVPAVHPGSVHFYGGWFVEPAVHILIWPVDVYLDAEAWDEADLADRPPRAAPEAPAVEAIEAVDADGTVEVRFSRPIRRGDLGPDTLGIHGLDGRVAVGVSVSRDRRTAWIRPLRPLAPGRWAARVLGRAIHDDAGVAIGHDVQVGFDV